VLLGKEKQHLLVGGGRERHRTRDVFRGKLVFIPRVDQQPFAGRNLGLCFCPSDSPEAVIIGFLRRAEGPQSIWMHRLVSDTQSQRGEREK
jgi:hypothetical protein